MAFAAKAFWRSLSWPTRAVVITGVGILLAWPALFPELFARVAFLVSISETAILVCCILLFRSLWRHLAQMLSKPSRIVLIIGLGALVTWLWASSVIDQVESGSFRGSGGDVLVSTVYLAVCAAFALMILTIGCWVGLPLKQYILRMRKATVAALLVFSIQVLGTGAFIGLYRPTNETVLSIDSFMPCVGAWFFGGWENRPAATYRFELNHFEITYLFDTPDQQREWQEWCLEFIPRTGKWPIQILRRSETRQGIGSLDAIMLARWFDGPLGYEQDGTGRYVQLSAHFTIPGALLSIYPLVTLRWWIRQHRQEQRRRKGLCITCGYNLTGNISGLCPECGSLIEPAGSAN